MHRPERYKQFSPDVSSAVAMGQGRSYGDAALNDGGHVFLSERINRVLAFDANKGILRAEAGITLDDILNLIVPHGWFLPVTPGTRFVSLGGAIAADVHGKNHHHDGSIGAYVCQLQIALPGGKWLDCSPLEHPDVFWATVGGMGLTGFIGEAELRLKRIQSAYVLSHHRSADNLAELIDFFSNPDHDAPYTVAWIDCLAKGQSLGRGIFMAGNHALPDDLPKDFATQPFELRPLKTLSIPLNFPGWVLNPLSIGLFNSVYFAALARKRESFVTDYRSFFYPLDGIGHWNRMYGQRGFLQYQCVVPERNAYETLHQLLKRVSESRHASFLAVLKRMGPVGQGMLSFPMAGYTLALDLTLGNPNLFKLLDDLDDLVIQSGGRIYLAKDARLSPKAFRAMYPRYEEWLAVRNRLDPDHCINSSLAKRLDIGVPG